MMTLWKFSNLGTALFRRVCRSEIHLSGIFKFSTSQRTFEVVFKLKDNLQDCYFLLNLPEHCTAEELKNAYIKLAKVYHPDSQSKAADAKKFHQVKEAYQAIKRKMIEDNIRNSVINEFKDDDDEDIFKPLQAHHRQYLNNEGVGFGSQSERQKQYENYRVDKAQNNVFKYKMKSLMLEGENELVVKDQKAARRAKISHSIDRLVEDLIQEGISRGDFDNLPGAGKPLDCSNDNPFVDKATQKLNQILINDGLQPDWIMLQKEIRTDLKKVRDKLCTEYDRLGRPSVYGSRSVLWKMYVEEFETSLLDINIKINKFNLIVPILNKQMMPYNIKRELEKLCSNPDEYLPKDHTRSCTVHFQECYLSENEQRAELFNWGQFWTDLKEMFSKK